MKKPAVEPLCWEWRLPSGRRAAARLEPDSGLESVLVDGRVLSKAGRGTKAEGHVIPAAAVGETDGQAVVVTFDPRNAICILRVGREEISPDVWPAPRATRGQGAVDSAFPLGTILAVLVLLTVLGAGGYLGLRWRDARGASSTFTGVHRADNGLFVAHFPDGFSARPAVVPSGMSGLVIEDREKGGAIVIIAQAARDELRDPWALDKQSHGEAFANLPHGGGPSVELSRTDGQCLGQAGAIVRGRATSTRGEPAALWSCAFFRGDDGYVAMYVLGENAAPDEAAYLRRIIDATELTHLSTLEPAR